MMRLTMATCATVMTFTTGRVDDWIMTVNLDQLGESRVRRLSRHGIHLAPQEAIRFQKDCNPTTGYTWNLVELPEDSSFKITDDIVSDMTEEQMASGMVGVGSTCYWTVEAVSSSNGEERGRQFNQNFHIWYGHQWEGRENSGSSFIIPIHIS